MGDLMNGHEIVHLFREMDPKQGTELACKTPAKNLPVLPPVWQRFLTTSLTINTASRSITDHDATHFLLYGWGCITS